MLFDSGLVPAVAAKAAVPSTIVLEPPLGKLFVQLYDKRGRVRHANLSYQISGPEDFSGVTDERGILLHEDVFPGDYTLKFKLTIEIEGESVVDEYTSPLVVLPATTALPEVRQLGAVPRVVQARLKGMFFDTNKSFLLPASVAVFDRLRDLYRDNQPSKLLVLGHTDTTSEPRINDPLSLERAENTVAYLKDDVDAWLRMYGEAIAASRRWGDDEDQAMVFAMPDFESKPETEDPIRWFQRTRGLTVDGIAGPETRRELVKSYMDLDGVSLGDGEFAIEPIAHGCGENFPLGDDGNEIDAGPEPDKEDQQDRRVELFFFDSEFGIVPAPPGKNSGPGSTQYPAWRNRAELDRVHSLGPEDSLVLAWPDVYTKELPTDLKLTLEAAGRPTSEFDWSDGQVADGVREFTFNVVSGTQCTLTASSGDSELVLFREQPIVTGVPPIWQHTLNEFMFEQITEVTDFDREQGELKTRLEDEDEGGDDSFPG